MTAEYLPPEIDLPKHLKDPLIFSIKNHVRYNHPLYQMGNVFYEVLHGLRCGTIFGATYDNKEYNSFHFEIFKAISDNKVLYDQVRFYVEYEILAFLKDIALKGKPQNNSCFEVRRV